MALNPGQMRFVVRIDKRVAAQDAAGEPTNAWIPFAPPLRAQVEQTPGREIWNAEQRVGRIPTVFRIRYLPGVLPAMRLIWAIDNADRVFNITSALDPDGLRIEMVITTEELVEETP